MNDNFYAYPKIPSIYWRDMEGAKKIIKGKYENEWLEYLADLKWEATLKLDGTNVGLVWDGHKVNYQGRTERSSFSKPQIDFLEQFKSNDFEQMFEQLFGEKTIVVYGEMIGHGIQKCGAAYSESGYRFIVFDIYNVEDDVWYSREAVITSLKALGLESAPVVATGTLPELVAYVEQLPKDTMSQKDLQAEGVVARPFLELKGYKGQRIITKIKVKDLNE